MIRFEVARQQGFDGGDGGGFRQFREQVAQIGVGFQLVGLGRLDEGIQVGAGFDTAHRVTEQPVFPPGDKRTDGILGPVRIDLKTTVVEIANQFGPFVV